MNTLIDTYFWLHNGVFRRLKCFDGIPALALRLFVAPIMIVAGLNKFEHFDSTVSWFGDVLGMPFPELMAFLAATTELGGGLLLLVGLAVRWISIPLMFTMLIAAATVHWEYGWFAIAPTSAASSPARVAAALHIPAAVKSQAGTRQTRALVSEARQVLQQHGDYERLTSKGPFVILNNGIEFAATYFLMLLVLLFSGGGRFVSIDYWLDRWLRLPE